MRAGIEIPTGSQGFPFHELKGALALITQSPVLLPDRPVPNDTISIDTQGVHLSENESNSGSCTNDVYMFVETPSHFSPRQQ